MRVGSGVITLPTTIAFPHRDRALEPLSDRAVGESFKSSSDCVPRSRADLAAARFCNEGLSRQTNIHCRYWRFWPARRSVAPGTLLYWVYTRLSRVSPRTRREADHMACSVMIARILPHLLKHLFAGERPKRTLGAGIVGVFHALERRGTPFCPGTQSIFEQLPLRSADHCQHGFGGQP